MKWCCPIFEGFVAFAGQGGLSVVVVKMEGTDCFMLQARGVDADVEPGNTAFKLYIVEQQAIFHCPGCGVRLDRYYKKSLDSLRRDDLDQRSPSR